MIETAIKEIKEAELKAEQMQKDAYQRGKEIVLEAEAEAERQKRQTVQACKVDRDNALNEARRKASEKSQAIIKEGEAQAQALVDEKKAVADAAAGKIVDMLLAKYCEK
ncbi:MAG: hypothetical protein K2G31_01965 [Clostridia bacterium]|nr:hypothetical protein [Clostridia bacterium]